MILDRTKIDNFDIKILFWVSFLNVFGPAQKPDSNNFGTTKGQGMIKMHSDSLADVKYAGKLQSVLL